MPAYCSGVAAPTVRKSCTLRMELVSSGGAITQPTRQPVTEKVLLRLLIGDGAFAQRAERDGRNMFFAIEDDVFVNFIANDQAIVFFAQFTQDFQFGERKDFAGWVVRRIDNDGASARVESAL